MGFEYTWGETALYLALCLLLLGLGGFSVTI